MRKPVLPIVLAAVTALAALALAACGDDADSPFTTSTSTTAAGTTEATTTTTATTTTETTTVAPTLGPPPLPLEFLADGLNIVAFGATPEEAITVVGTYLGLAPTFDSGWGPAWGDYGACPGNEYRQVEFEGLVLQFTDADLFQPAGTRHFFAWSYDGTPPDVAFGPLEVGTTVAELQALYPAVQLFADDPIYGDTFRVEGADGEQLWGRLTGVDPGDTIVYLTGGWGCGE